jgi:hypothetical protein
VEVCYRDLKPTKYLWLRGPVRLGVQLAKRTCWAQGRAREKPRLRAPDLKLALFSKGAVRLTKFDRALDNFHSV